MISSEGACRQIVTTAGMSQGRLPWMTGTLPYSTKYLALAELAACTLGKPLNKALQTSDWQKRPLTAGQLLYAAIDAHVSVRVFQHIWDNSSSSERKAIKKTAQHVIT